MQILYLSMQWKPHSCILNIIIILTQSAKHGSKDLYLPNVAFWVTNPCRITRKVKQTKMYVCTLEEFILVDIWIHCCASWN